MGASLALSCGYCDKKSYRNRLVGIQRNGQSTQGFGLLAAAYATVQRGFKPWAVIGGLRTSF